MITIEAFGKMSHHILQVKIKHIKRINYEDFYDLILVLDSGMLLQPGETICIKNLSVKGLIEISRTINALVVKNVNQSIEPTTKKSK
jgi:hypothetical protein